ncbi:DUF4041 domain-containing protein [Weissella viridescens]|uniref:DUF4041 domain-containing protein n=1 Tax=Weissella viridescens TaxID=1629 RepID=UPI003526D425
MFNIFKPRDEVLESKLIQLEKEISNKTIERDKLNQEINDARMTINLQEYGLYEKQYKFTDSLKYKDELKLLREKAKYMITKSKTAAIITSNMTLNNSASQGRAMQNALIKSAIRGFNGEADALLTKITVSNLEAKQKSLKKSWTQLNKLYSRNSIEITEQYLEVKSQELRLAAEYELEKQHEKEILREQREKEREEKKLNTELAEKRKEIQKDKNHYFKLIKSLSNKLEKNYSQEIQEQLQEYQTKISELEATESDLDYRQGHATAGYVYIISNIGSFGENIFKIGVTRRLDPFERIKELGSASVPFQFDVHAMIFSEDAFELESKLHNKFAKHKVNKINSRKEYFYINIDEIKAYLNQLENVSIEFTDTIEAFEYNESLKIKNTL